MYVRESNIRWNEQAAAAPPRTSEASPPRAVTASLPSIVLDGVTLHAITEQRCIEYILSELSSGRGGVVVTPNLDHIRRCRNDMSFAALVSEADLILADGMPLVWASRLQATPLPQRVAGSDLISSLSAAAANHSKSIFLLGGDPGTADAAAAILKERYPKLKITGTFCPAVGFEHDPIQIQRIVATLQAASPDIIYVGLGSPKQERLIGQIRHSLPSAWWLGVGVSFSFLCGNVKRAPNWMRKIGLEWVHRLIQEPRRLFKRYLVVGVPFAGMMLLRAAVRGIPVRLGRKPKTAGMNGEARFASSNAFAAEENSNGNGSDHPDRKHVVATPLPSVTLARPEAYNREELMRAAPSLKLEKLRGLVLLGGSVRAGTLASAVGRSVMDLPTGNGATILTRWLDQAADVAKLLGMEYLPLRLLIDRQAIEPRSIATAEAQRCRVERDTSEYRGTGGLLANIALDYQDDDLILIGNAAQILLEPLPMLLLSLRTTGGEFTLVAHEDGTPSGLMLVTCRTLRLIPNVGFVDMKEQALPAIAKRHDVRVLHRTRPTGLTVRSLSDYVTALRALYRPMDEPLDDQTLAENWESAFSIVEPGASVAPSARVQDSIVLAGATIEAGAVLVRSVVAGGAVVRKDRKAVDQCVTANTKAK